MREPFKSESRCLVCAQAPMQCAKHLETIPDIADWLRQWALVSDLSGYGPAGVVDADRQSPTPQHKGLYESTQHKGV